MGIVITMAEFFELFEGIAVLISQIRNREKKKEEDLGVKCPICNETNLTEHYFCPKCNTHVLLQEPVEKQDISSEMICPECGHVKKSSIKGDLCPKCSEQMILKDIK